MHEWRMDTKKKSRPWNKESIIEEIVDKNRYRTVPSQIPIHLQQPDESFFLPVFCCFTVGVIILVEEIRFTTQFI